METNYPLLSDRLKSTFIDGMLLLGLTFLTASLLDKLHNPAIWVRITVFVFVTLLYDPVCTSLGATVGNLVMGIRVRNFDNTSKRINILQAVVRYILKMLLGWISFLTIHSNPERRAIHDMGAGSVMVKV